MGYLRYVTFYIADEKFQNIRYKSHDLTIGVKSAMILNNNNNSKVKCNFNDRSVDGTTRCDTGTIRS